MINNRISGRQFRNMAILFLLGSSLVLGIASEAGQDSWIAILIAFFLCLPVAAAYARLLQLYPGQNLYDIALRVFGKIVGKIIILFYVLYAIHLGSGVLRTFSEFIQIASMPETPQIMMLAVFTLLCIWLAGSGVETMGRVSSFVLPIVVISVAITVLLALKDMDFSNIEPIMATKFPALLDSTTSVFALPFAELILFTVLYSSVGPKENPYALFASGLGIAALLMVIIDLRNLFVLGVPSMTMYYFPSYEAVSVISFGEFFTRIEVLIGMNLVLAGCIKVCVCIFAASDGVARLFNLNSCKYMVAPVGTILLLCASVMYANVTELAEWLKIYKYFALPFQVIVPFILLAAAEIKTRAGRLIQKNNP